MPTYGYRCTVCAHQFERFQKMTDAPVAECESCGGAVKKLLYPVGIQFKGSGFYVTDYVGNGGQNSGKANGTGESGADSKGEGGSQSTGSETKSESGTATTTTATSGKTESKSEQTA